MVTHLDNGRLEAAPLYKITKEESRNLVDAQRSDEEAIAIKSDDAVVLLSWTQAATAADRGIFAIQSGLSQVTVFAGVADQAAATSFSSPVLDPLSGDGPCASADLSGADALPCHLRATVESCRQLRGVSLNRTWLTVFSDSFVEVFQVKPSDGSILISKLSFLETTDLVSATVHVANEVCTVVLARKEGIELRSPQVGTESQTQGSRAQAHYLLPPRTGPVLLRKAMQPNPNQSLWFFPSIPPQTDSPK
ncbi:tetratricopeptide repeat-containing protein [Cystoisospora suis]|uniref:Tetratricopeptide repeat-containing protein n=1 Tax=Cystoisospora suis TaxID=483139 RepID=A0A2C6KG20_9APIC|nr:tetratricopeptide repeat-containing protein [Cystoisospora suis]